MLAGLNAGRTSAIQNPEVQSVGLCRLSLRAPLFSAHCACVCLAEHVVRDGG